MGTDEQVEFTVDTGLFRQLGELLVGRDATALVELVKNAYDADSTRVVLRGENLDDPDAAVLILSDNGNGMTGTQFRRGFLRLASRNKAGSERKSPVYRRKFTGEKGVGRLAAHKLAAQLNVSSVAAIRQGTPAAEFYRTISPKVAPAQIKKLIERLESQVVTGSIDWDKIEEYDTISAIKSGLDLNVEDRPSDSVASGTTLKLTRLRHAWTRMDLDAVVRQLSNFEPPRILATPVPSKVLAEPLLFASPEVRDSDRSDPGMTLELQGDFREQDEFWGSVARTAEWVLEIRAQRGHPVMYTMAPTEAGLAENPFGRRFSASAPHPAPETGPFFDARLFLRPGSAPSLERDWNAVNSGVRVYLEGFRVLPYGEQGNDWLNIDLDYTRRAGRFSMDPLIVGPADDLRALKELKSRDISLRLLPNRAYFGAVFLTDTGAASLRTLVNREGFVPDHSYETMIATVRRGIDLLQRSWALASLELKREQDRLATADDEPDSDQERETGSSGGASDAGNPDPSPDGDDAAHGRSGEAEHGEDESRDDADEFTEDDELWARAATRASSSGSASRLQASIEQLRSAFNNYDANPIFSSPDDVIEKIDRVDAAGSTLVEEASLLRTLASVGSQLASFTHEIGHLVPLATAAERALKPTHGVRWPSQAVGARNAVSEVRAALERQAAYLLDITSSTGRRRRTRQELSDRVEAAFLALRGAAAGLSVQLVNEVPAGAKTPPMFRSDLQAILANLLSNAIKAAGRDGRVAVSASDMTDSLTFVIQNTGVAVQPEDAERWFQPYASTTLDVDPVLGQGMGLGLPITRGVASEYGGTVRFVRPGTGYATAIEVVIPE